MIALWLLLLGVGSAAEQQTVRIALVAGANDGGLGRIPLRYAVSDADSVRSVLTDLAGVQPGDVVRLEEPGVEQLDAAMAELRERVGAARSRANRTEVFVYYSGHSDETGLLLGGDHYRFADLRKQLEKMGSDVTVAIVDSCSSGALVRTKGGQTVPAFLQDDSTAVEGLAVLTSSSQDEASQESDRLGGSFFTQALVAALRGAADQDGDLRVTIGEAYRYAYDETIARTESTTHGAQHPNWDIQLKGTGDLVLSDMRVAESGLVVDAGQVGRLSVRDDRGRLVLEVGLRAVATPELALPAGTYTVLIEQTAAALRAETALLAGESITLGPDDFLSVELQSYIARGSELRHVVTGAAWYPDLTAEAPTLGERHTLAFGLAGYRAARLDGFAFVLGYSAFDKGLSGVQMGLGFARSGASTDGVQLSAGGAFTRGRLRGAQVGAVAVAPEVHGAQLGGLTQTGEVQGIQLGVVNISSHVRGAQIGLVNIAGHVRGTQIGGINIATRRSGASVGAISVASDGIADVELWASETPQVFVGAKLGGRSSYTAYSFGIDARQRPRPGLGIGGRAVMGPLQLDIDGFVAAQLGPHFAEDDISVDPGMRLSIGGVVTDWFAPFVGVDGHFIVPVRGNPAVGTEVRDGIGAGASLMAGVRF